MAQIETAHWTDLITKALSGDRASYERFLSEASQWLTPHARKMMGSADVEDIVQNTLIAIHNSLHTFDLGLRAEPWVYTILKYKVFDARKQNRRAGRFETLEEKHEQISVQNDEPLQREQAEQILMSLPEDQAQALRMTKIDGYSIKETAEALNKTESWVKVNIHRSLQKLKDELKEAFK